MAASFARLSRFLAAACAIAIAAASAWAFLAFSACADRDPLHFEAVMTPNAGSQPASARGAEAHTAQVLSRVPISQS
jgi:hypothetical protein